MSGLTVDELEALVVGLKARLDEIDDAFVEMNGLLAPAVQALTDNPPQPGVAASSGDGTLTPIDLAALENWLSQLFLPTFRKPLAGGPGRRWCASWWLHGEAIIRLESMRRAWMELSAGDGTGIGVWFRDHYEPGMRELLSDTGPFAMCNPGQPDGSSARHTLPDQLRVAPLPAELCDIATTPLTVALETSEE